MIGDLLASWRRRIVDRATDPFGHAEYPLAQTLDHRGDPGLFGPDSVSWRVIGDASAFVGGIRALLVQAAHPEVVAGVKDHSNHRADPLGRLSRTSSYVTATSHGALPEVRRAVAMVRRAHRPVRGTSHRDLHYEATDPGMAAWVHDALTDSFLHAYQAYGPQPLSAEEADQFVLEQTQVGRLLDADPLPENAEDLANWIDRHPGGAGDHAGPRGGDPRRRSPRDRSDDREDSGDFLRWALGSSPSWNGALVRVGAEIPEGLFHQPLPVADVTSTATERTGTASD